jgi:penicillin amidase
LPQGESGEPGSGHYTDQAEAWIAGRLWPLPFSDAAVQRAAESRETLAP